MELMILKELPLTPYSTTLWLIFTGDPDHDITRLNYKNKGLAFKWGNDFAANVHDTLYKGYIIVAVFDTRHLDPDTVAHEVIHIKNKLFKHSGVKLDPDNDEPEAYFVGWLTNEILKQSKLKK